MTRKYLELYSWTETGILYILHFDCFNDKLIMYKTVQSCFNFNEFYLEAFYNRNL